MLFKGFQRISVQYKINTNHTVNRMSSKVICLLLIGFTLLQCSDEQAVEKEKPPVYFTLSQLQRSTSGGRSASPAEEPKAAFALGDIHASKEFLFLLGNGAEESIFDVELTSNNSQFQVSPKKISVLAGTKSDESALIPLVSVGAIHGVQLEGVGFTDLMPMGVNTVTVTITGKVIENGDSVEVKSTFDMNVDAKRMDVALFSENTEVDITKPEGMITGFGGATNLPAVAYYTFEWEKFKIKNIGNVNIKVSVVDPEFNTTIASHDMAIGQTISIPELIPIVNNAIIIRLDGKGTISDQSRIDIGTDGNGYFVLQRL